MENIEVYIQCHYHLEKYDCYTTSSTSGLVWEFLLMDSDFDAYLKRIVGKVMNTTKGTGQTIKELRVDVYCSQNQNDLEVNLTFFTVEGCTMEIPPFKILFDNYNRLAGIAQKGFAVRQVIENEYNILFKKSTRLYHGLLIFFGLCACVLLGIALNSLNYFFLLVTILTFIFIRVIFDSLGFFIHLLSPKETELKVLSDVWEKYNITQNECQS